MVEYGRKAAKEEKTRVETIEERRRMDDEKEKRRDGTRLNSARIQNERTNDRSMSGETERRRGWLIYRGNSAISSDIIYITRLFTADPPYLDFRFYFFLTFSKVYYY